MNIPDWLWRELVGNAVWEIPTVLVPLAWKYRKVIMNTLGLKAERRVINLQPLTLHAKAQPVLLSGTIEGKSTLDGTLTVGKSVDLRWNVEAPTPSLARRLEELASWWLHIS
jgi:hypothetical protein